MKINTVITLLLVLPILVNCQTIENTKSNLEVEPMSFDKKTQRPDIRGIISYDKYQVVVANGNETVEDIAKRLGLDPRKFSLFNGLVESYRPRQGELLALNKKIDPIKKQIKLFGLKKILKMYWRERKKQNRSLCQQKALLSIRLKQEKQFIP